MRILSDPAARDQDDMCIWINPNQMSRSTVITADKKAHTVFVYDLNGTTLQTLPSDRPGNIDIRQNVQWNGTACDVVVWNERGSGKIIVCVVNPTTRTLSRIDNGTLLASHAYGCALYHNPDTGTVYVFTTAKTGRIEQHALRSSSTGTITSVKVRSFVLAACEAAVADDEQKLLFLSCEKEGIWKIGAEPHDSTPAVAIDRIGHNGLCADVEGITIYREQGGGGYIIVSSQGNSRFNVYERKPPHRFLGSFHIRGVRFTDGIDVTGGNFGDEFTDGLFACHNGAAKERCPVVLVPWHAIAEALKLKKGGA
ncbi:MAG: phytase [Desulfobacterota bacterium]|nr:phytase [Thermodesulfobacteriota bacterium]